MEKKYIPKCYVCSKDTTESDVTLMESANLPFLKISIAQAIVKLLGENCMVLISKEDFLCNECTELFNELDCLELMLSKIKEEIVQKLMTRYDINTSTLPNPFEITYLNESANADYLNESVDWDLDSNRDTNRMLKNDRCELKKDLDRLISVIDEEPSETSAIVTPHSHRLKVHTLDEKPINRRLKTNEDDSDEQDFDFDNLERIKTENQTVTEMLEELGIEDFHIYSSPNEDDDNYVLRLPYKCEEDIERFLATLKERKNMTWRVTDTKPKTMSAGRKNLFHKVYHCQSGNNRIRKFTTSPHPKHTACPASMKITIKRVPKRCRSKDIYLPEYPTVLRINNNHNHLLFSADNLKYKDVSNETKEKFKTLFENGHSPHSALDMHKFDLLLQHGDNYYVVVADRSLCPDIHWCYRLYYSVRASEFGTTKVPETQEYLQSKIEKLRSKYSDLIAISICEDKPVIAICTNLMKRIHTMLPQSQEIVLVDSIVGFDRFQHRIFLLLTSSFAGPLPLGIIITSIDNSAALESGLRSILKLVGDTAFYSSSAGPKVIMSGKNSAERDALKAVFPNSYLLFSPARILQSVWQDLWKKDSSVEQMDKPEVFRLIKGLINSSDELDLNNTYTDLTMKNVIIDSYPLIKQYIYNLWKDRENWSLSNRKKLSVPGNYKINDSESIMRILKDITYNRKKPFNIVQVIDFVCSRFDSYYEQKLFELCIGKDNSLQIRNELFRYNATNLELEKISEVTYRVLSEGKKTYYLVDAELQLCSCPAGSLGGPCAHQAAVLALFNINSSDENIFTATIEQRKLIQLIALRKSDLSKELVKKEKNTDSEDNTAEVTQEKSLLRAEYNKFASYFHKSLETENGVLAFKKFFHNFNNLKTESAFKNALRNFGQRGTVSSSKITVERTNIRSAKRKLRERNSYPVNKSRRKDPPDLPSVSYCTDNVVNY